MHHGGLVRQRDLLDGCLRYRIGQHVYYSHNFVCILPEKLLPLGAPQESDWWEEVNNNELATDTSNDSSNADNDSEEDPTSIQGARRFRNCGLATWNQTRSVWKDYHEPDSPAANGQSSTELRSIAKANALTKSQRKELMRAISSHRTYQLKQRVGLKDMIDTYNEMWSEELE